jgi:MFS family permease
MRTHGLTSGEAGTWMAIGYGLGGGMGVLAGGFFADRLVKVAGDGRWYAWLSAITIGLTSPLMVGVLWASGSAAVLGCLTIAMFLGHMHLGCVTTMMQGLAGLRRRAMVVGFYLFFVNLISMGVGPVLVGAISDALNAQFGTEALRYSLLTVVPAASLWSALHLALAGRTFLKDGTMALQDR